MKRLDDMEARLAAIETVLGKAPETLTADGPACEPAVTVMHILADRFRTHMRSAGMATMTLDTAAVFLSADATMLKTLIRDALIVPVKLEDGIRVSIVTETERGQKVTRVVLR